MQRLDPALGLPELRRPWACTPGTFEILARDGDARAARLWTAHGPVETPCFMPVGTYGAVKGMTGDDLERVGVQVVLGNAYHLRHRPGLERLRAAGGLHGFSTWRRAILTDSGGYQVFSLRGLQKIRDDGVEYRTHFDGSLHTMTPRSVLEAQAAMGSDVCMVLDHCPPGDADAGLAHEAVDRSLRWAREAATIRREILAPEQLCFGIVQGGTDRALRLRHLAATAELGFDGLALGGLSVGEPIPEMHATLQEIGPAMPAERPRYVMGIGTPIDLLVAVSAGIDMFDCVMPTRHARNGQVFTFGGRINIRVARHRDDRGPIDPACGCPACRAYGRDYLRHLHEHDDPLWGRLATLHNLWFYQELVAMMRQALRAGHFARTRAELAGRLSAAYGPGAPPAEP